ncbi:MAG: hypothetical protein ACOY82_02205 [Pseudomonadota bacterium]
MRPLRPAMLRAPLVCLLLLIAFVATAGNARQQREEIRKQAELSLTVTGTIDIDASGDVVGYALDDPDKLPKGIVDMTARQALHWKFEPVPLQANAYSRSKMTLVFVAKKLDGGRYEIATRSASFENPSPQARASLDPKSRRMPEYPMNLLRGAEVSGTVYLVLRYDREGAIVDLDVEQVNLRVIGSEAQMAQWRTALARASTDAAKHWRMLVPPGDIPEGERYGIGRVPVAYMFENQRPTRYGQWEAYIPGPRSVIPWWDVTSMAATPPEALAPGAFHGGTTGRRLLTPLDGG